MKLTKFTATVSAYFETEAGKKMLVIFQRAFVGGILVYLTWELTKIGWGEVLSAIPTNPWFYILFLVLYFQLPFAEMFAYRATWDFGLLKSLPAFVKKRIYNKEVMGYSGEVYFYAWARKTLGLSKLDVFKTIRDNNTLSSIASTLIAVTLLLVFLELGAIKLSDVLPDNIGTYIIIGVIIIPIFIALFIKFRQYLFSMPLRTTLIILGIHCFRLVIGQVLQILQWSAALPEVPYTDWFTYGAVSLLVSRLPFVPNRDLIFLSLGIKMASSMNMIQSEVAGMLLMLSVLGKVFGIAMFAGIDLGRAMGWLPEETQVEGEDTDVDEVVNENPPAE